MADNEENVEPLSPLDASRLELFDTLQLTLIQKAQFELLVEIQSGDKKPFDTSRIDSLLNISHRLVNDPIFGLPPLHWAVSRGNTKMVQYLIEKGAYLDALTSDKSHFPGETVLHVAVRSNKIEMAPFLINAGVETDATDFSGHTALDRAVISNDVDMVKILLENGADPLSTIPSGTFQITNNHSYKTVHSLLDSAIKAKSDQNIIESEPVATVKSESVEKPNPIIPEAIKKQFFDAIIMGNPANIPYYLHNWPGLITAKSPDIFGYSPLCAAVYNALPRNQQHGGYTPDMITFLLNKGADPNAKATNGDSPLSLAIWKCRDDILRTLLENGADPNAKANDFGNITGNNEEPPLHLAIRRGRVDLVDILLEKRADPSILNYEQKTPAQLAQELSESYREKDPYAGAIPMLQEKSGHQSYNSAPKPKDDAHTNGHQTRRTEKARRASEYSDITQKTWRQTRGTSNQGRE